MKSNPKIKPLFVIALGIVITFSALIFIDLNSNTGNKDKINGQDGNLEISAVSGKIHIDGNSGWVDFKNADLCTGSGIWNDPYFIEDLVIDGGGSGDGISIENSNVYFRIENCTVSNSGTGIRLDYVDNGQLYGNAANYNYRGIYLSSSDNNTISENTANSNNNKGIYLYLSDNNTILGNTANSNNDYGIYLDNSHSTTISENTANSNSDNGISLFFSNSNTILGNTANYNYYNGIRLYESSENTVSGNTVDYNYRGITLTSSNSNDISRNIITNNYIYGILISSGKCNKISDNSFSNNRNEDIQGTQEECNSFPYEIVTAIVITIVVFTLVITVMTLFYKRKRKRRIEVKYPKKSLEEKKIKKIEKEPQNLVQIKNKDREMDWKYCKTCKRIVEPETRRHSITGFILGTRSGSKRILRKKCPYCGKYLTPKEIGRIQNYAVLVFVFIHPLFSLFFMMYSMEISLYIYFISFLALIIGFELYWKLILKPRLKKKMPDLFDKKK